MRTDNVNKFAAVCRYVLAPLLALLLGPVAAAGPYLPAGDSVLRHDVQLLADRGIITGPVTTWPLAWGPILADLRNYSSEESVTPDVAASISRLSARAAWETRTREVTFAASAGVAEAPTKIRGFESTPREDAELGLGASWVGNQVAFDVNAQIVSRTDGGSDVRADGSMVGFALGNWALSANTYERWWGPGWDGSLILSSNARPVPALSLDRIDTSAFANRWLHWIGPWDFNVSMGQLESDRAVRDALWFGMRFSFRPLQSLEIGLSRTAQWCGDGRPCDAGVFADLLLGQDNIGDNDIGDVNEPGNQLAGVDFRWSRIVAGVPLAIYGQLIGEDEAGGFPSRYIGQFGVESSGSWGNYWSWRSFAEFAGTSCQFHESSELFNCAYNHGIYQTGYRYRGRSIGHGADNDARLLSAGLMLVNEQGSSFRLLVRTGRLNRGGSQDLRNTVSSIPRDIRSIDLAYDYVFRYGIVAASIGHEELEPGPAQGSDGMRFSLEWRSAY